MAKPPISDYFPHSQAFGPTSTNSILDKDVFATIFYKENLLYRELSRHPSIIIGRRGSGKTTFLRSTLLDTKYRIVVELPAAPVFRQIINSINQISTGVPFVEEVAEFWDVLLWTTLLAKLAEAEQASPELEKVRKFLSGLGIKSKRKPYDIIRTTINVLKTHGGGKPIGIVGDLIDKIAFDDVSFSEARDAALDFMEHKKISGIILLDSLEEFPLDQATMSYAISGLLKCQAEFRQPGSPQEIRCCLPAELYHDFLRISSNPNKDFQQKVVLHWHGGELLQLACHRYALYLKIHDPASYKKFERLDLDDRADAQAFWNSIFPITMNNSLGSPETSPAYILRHTQLTPRHFLLYLNEINARNRRRKGSPLKFEERAIVEGIRAIEETICMEIFKAFKHKYPSAETACKQTIPYLPLRFEDGQLHHVYNLHGQGIPGVYEYNDFLRLMIEIGAVGRVTGETARYILGTFEYTTPHLLITSSDDELRLHPVFTEVFSAKKPKPGPQVRVVYPFGSDVEQEEYRELE